MNKFNKLSIFAISIMVIASSCKKEDTQPDPVNGIIINDNIGENSLRITSNPNGEIYPIVSYGKQKEGLRTSSIDSTSRYNLKLIATVAPPTYQGKTLQATHVDIINGKAYISYNTQFADYVGGIDVIDITSSTTPVISQSAILPNTDVSALTYNNNKLYFAGARNMDAISGITGPAYLGQIDLNNSLLTTNVAYKELGGYVANSVKVELNTIYVTSGNTNGGVYLIDRNNLNTTQTLLLNGAKDIAMTASDFIVLEGAYSGSATQTLKMYNRASNALTKSITIPSGINPEAKSNITSYQNNVLVANGYNGITYWNTTTNNRIDYVGLPDTLAGIDTTDIYTNSVSTDNSYVYGANGAAGLMVAKINSTSNVIEILGKADVGGSANYVKASNGYIFVAAGKAGVKIFKLEPKATTPVATCTSSPSLLSNILGYYNVNSGDYQSFTSILGGTFLGGLNVNSNSTLNFCGTLNLLYSSNVNSVFLISGNLNCKQTLNINSGGTLKVDGNVVIDGTLNFNGTIEFVRPGCTFQVKGNVNKNSGYKVINPSYNVGPTIL